MLLHARMDLTMVDLGLQNIPSAMAFAMPCGQGTGVHAVGVLMVHGRLAELRRRMGRFLADVYPSNMFSLDGWLSADRPDEHILVFVFSERDRQGHTVYTTLVFHVPQLDACLRSPTDLRDTLLRKRLSAGRPSDAMHQMYHTDFSSDVVWHGLHLNTILVVRLLVYMKACPEHVVQGFPNGEIPSDYSSRWTTPTPIRVRSPEGLEADTEHAERNGPTPHYRTCHFRRFPVRSDGTRQDGILFIHDTFVNAHVDPWTVQKGGRMNPGIDRRKRQQVEAQVEA
jgi:hypothetical protein